MNGKNKTSGATSVTLGSTYEVRVPQAPEAQVCTPQKQRSRNKHNGRAKDK